MSQRMKQIPNALDMLSLVAMCVLSRKVFIDL